MASRCRRRLAAALVVAALAAAGPAGAAVDLAGTWYVLVHYTDGSSPSPQAARWDERIWVFEPEGERLRWIEYPLVIFDDDAGRFERTTRQYARVVAAWEPSPTQLAQIASGLRINPRGSRSKALRGSTRSGWRSASPMSAGGANVLTFDTTWSIADPGGLPAFTIEESLGGPGAEGLEGVTEYRTTEIDGGVLRGSYARDGTRRGTFRMLPTPPVREVEGAKTQQELRSKLAARDPGAQQALAAMLRDALVEELQDRSLDPREVDVDRVVNEYTRMLREGRSVDEIEETLEDQVIPEVLRSQLGWAKPGAVHDDGARYRLPFEPSTPRQLGQGVNGTFSHTGRHRYSFDFTMPVGTPVVAARDGTVARVVDGFTRGGPLKSLMGQANVVMIEHADGSVGNYVHLSPGIPVKKGQRVAAGDVIGASGNTGYSSEPHLHFSVWSFDAKGEPQSVSILFSDAGQRDFVPQTGLYYGGLGSSVR